MPGLFDPYCLFQMPAAAWLRRGLPVLGLAMVCALAGCTSRGLIFTAGPDYRPAGAPVPQRWAAGQPPTPAGALAHDGDPARLVSWWARFDDPVLLALMQSAQQQSANVAQAGARIERARADAVAADAVALPVVDGKLSFNRSAVTFGGPLLYLNQTQLGAQASWEIDLFGGRARQREAALARLQSSTATWHDARVSVAVETANAYLNHRYCEQQVALAREDFRSRAQSYQLAAIAGRAGFQPQSGVLLSRASVTEANAALTQRRSQCELSVKALVALTGLDEQVLRAQLSADPSRYGRLPRPPAFAIGQLPAAVLLQRPDVAAAERDLAAASADIGVAQAQRYPVLSLAGNLTPSRISVNGSPAVNLNTWAIGPALQLPLFDGGRRRANVDATSAQYLAADQLFRSRVRGAAREVEEALVRLATVDERLPDIVGSLGGYQTALDAATTRLNAGLGSVIEREEARRPLLSARAALGALEQERVSAWIALYRAAGGGWDGSLPSATMTEEPAKQ